MEKSTHKVEVVPIELQKHPNADALSVIPIYGYTYCGRTEDWQGVSKGAWCPPDSLVDTKRPEFAFLANDAKFYADSTKDEKLDKGVPSYARIKAKKLRGIVSYGLLIPVDDNVELGTDMAETLGVTHYEPPIKGASKKTGFASYTEIEAGPALFTPKYDVDSFQRYAQFVFTEGEPVWVTEKIHGANGRWVYHNGRFYCGSRTEWKKEFAEIIIPDKSLIIEKLLERTCSEAQNDITDEVMLTINERADKIIADIQKKNEHPQQNPWWKGLRKHPELMAWLQAHPDTVVYGELYGSVQDLTYGVPQGEVRIGVFDLLIRGDWVNPVQATQIIAPELPWVPSFNKEYAIRYKCEIPYHFDTLVGLAEGNSLVPGAEKQIREGIVVKPLYERTHPSIGRVQLKIVSPAYLEKSK